jgi:hypothetical protein
VWLGGVFDGDSPSNAGGWSYQSVWGDWCGMKVDCARVTVAFTSFINWVNHPLVATGDYLVANSLRFKDCATGPVFGYNYYVSNVYTERPAGAGAVGQIVRGVVLEDIGNIGVADTLQHAFDVYNAKGGTYADITIIGMDGAADGRSNTCSGLTVFLSEQCAFDNIVYDSPVSTECSHLAFSFLGAVNCTLTDLRAYNFAGLGLEMLTTQGCTVNGGVIDGNYASGITSATNSIGVSISAGRYDRDTQSRASAGSKTVTVNGLVVRRAGLGMSLRSGHIKATGCYTTGCIGSGILVQETTVTSSFPGAIPQPLLHVDLNECVSEFNGAHGVNFTNASLVSISGGSYRNNGQNSALAATSRAGVTGATVSRLVIMGASLDDTQTFTDTNGISFAAGTATDGFYDLAAYVPRSYQPGQYITLTDGGGAGVDITGKVVDTDGDLLTISVTPGTVFSSTGNTTALTGTWSGSGRTLTGTGGAALTEILGPVWVVSGGAYRLVENVTGNNAIQLTEAFPSPLSGATLSKVNVDAVGIPSQQYGARIFGTVTSWLLRGNSYSGNVLERVNVSTPSGGEPGSEYFRKSTTAIATTPVSLQTGIPLGHRFVGYAAKVTTAISGGGATSWGIRVRDSGDTTTRETVNSGVALALNTSSRGNTTGYAAVAANDIVQFTAAGGTPSAGEVALETMWRVEALPAL